MATPVKRELDLSYGVRGREIKLIMTGSGGRSVVFNPKRKEAVISKGRKRYVKVS